MPAAPALHPADHLEEHAPAMLDERRIGRWALAAALQERAPERQIPRGHEEKPEGVVAVAPGPPHLLVVRLERARRTHVDHGAHVGAVDAHAERVGGGDDLGATLGEVPLRPIPLRGREPGVIDADAPAGPGEALRLLFRPPPGRRVDDGGAPRPARPAERLGKRGIHHAPRLARARHLDRAQGEVRAREAPHDLGRVGGQAQPRDDLVAYHRRGGGRAREHARPGQGGEQRADLHVLRAEVVTPLADAVRLVHRDQRAVEVGKERAKAGEGQTLRRHVHESVRARGHPAHPPAYLAAFERGGEEGRGHAARGERLHLIVHQGDQRGDHERRAGPEGRGELIREALATPGGRHEEEPAVPEERLDRLALAGPELSVPEPGEPRGEVESLHEASGRLHVHRAVIVRHGTPADQTVRPGIQGAGRDHPGQARRKISRTARRNIGEGERLGDGGRADRVAPAARKLSNFAGAVLDMLSTADVSFAREGPRLA